MSEPKFTPGPWLIASAPALYEALAAVHGAMLYGGDGDVGDYGWNVTKLNKARPLIRAALSQALGETAPKDTSQVTAEMLPVNHEEALLLAQMTQGESNLARCYLAMTAALSPPQDTGVE